MTDEDVRKIGDEMVRLLEPIYEDLESLKQDTRGLKQDTRGLKQDTQSLKQDARGLKQDIQSLKQDNIEIKKILNEHTDKIDALTADVIELQAKADFTNDRFLSLEEKLEKDQKEHNKIKQLIGLS